jgi:hypothetical protein
MPDSKDEKIEIVRLIPADGSTIHRKETLAENSEDETVSREVKVTELTVHACSHPKGYAYTCSICSRSYCVDCLPRVRYCRECQATLGPCCSKEMCNGTTYCAEHSPLIDWSGPVRIFLEVMIALAALALTLHLLWRLVG